ncbi:MAG: hypothetical protein ACKVT0_16620, partial [Planctomycetaceae bacterium]
LSLRLFMVATGVAISLFFGSSFFIIQKHGGPLEEKILPIILGILVFLFFCSLKIFVDRLRVTIGINGEQIVHLISSGPFRWKRVWETATVTGVSIRSTVVNPTRDQQKRQYAGRPVKIWSLCTLDFPEQYHWLSIGPEKPFSREVAGLVRYQLHRLGNRLLDDSAAE